MFPKHAILGTTSEDLQLPGLERFVPTDGTPIAGKKIMIARTPSIVHLSLWAPPTFSSGVAYVWAKSRSFLDLCDLGNPSLNRVS